MGKKTAVMPFDRHCGGFERKRYHLKRSGYFLFTDILLVIIPSEVSIRTRYTPDLQFSGRL
jgi:hypothetical protein